MTVAAPSSQVPARPAVQPGGVTRVLRLRRDVEVVADPADPRAVLVGHPWGRLRLAGIGAGAAELLVAMAADSALGVAVDGAPDDAATRVRALLTSSVPFLARLDVCLLDVGADPLVVLEPVSASARALASPALEATSSLVLPRHAYLRRADEGSGWDATVLESPLALHRAVLTDPRAAGFVAALGARTALADAAASAGLPLGTALAVAEALTAAGLVEPGGQDVRGQEPADARLWGFHELLFHSLSRPGRHDHVTGGVYGHQDLPSPRAIPAVTVDPAASPSEAGYVVELAVPAFDAVVAADPTLTQALEGRRSVRRNERPLSLDALGELLYRAARARRVSPAPESPTGQEGVDRPYPMGGGLGELELYLAVRSCDGLEPGGYRYDSAGHRLVRLASRQADLDTLLAGAVRATNGQGEPQVLVTVTSRLGRVTWKYAQIGYALTLKHVGVLYQTAYLVASAMDLGMCALGSGDVEAATRAFGLSWPAETSVGEFLLGGGPIEGGPVAVAAFADVVDAARR